VGRDVAEVAADNAFPPGIPKPLFQGPPLPPPVLHNIFIPSWDVDPDGSRFLFATSATETSKMPFTVILNWQAGLKK
jgi:hypothetical protein